MATTRILKTNSTFSTSGGRVATVSVSDGGTGYSVDDVLTLVGGYSNCTVTVTGVTGGVIDTISITTAGGGYTVTTFAVTGGTGNDDAVISVDTIAGDWKKLDYQTLSTAIQSAPYTYVSSSTGGIYGGAFNPTVGVSLQGVWLLFNRYSTTGTMTVYLQENTGTWGDVATSAAVNLSSISSKHAFVYFPFTTPYTGTANQFKVGVKTSTASTVRWYGSAGAEYFGIVGNEDDTTLPVTGQTLVVQDGVTLTMDKSFDFGVTGGAGMWIGSGSNVTIPHTMTSQVVLELNTGNISFASDAGFDAGTSSNRIPAGMLVINSSNSTLFTGHRTYYVTESKQHFTLYGATADIRIVVNGDTTSSDVVNTVEDIPTNWQDGDTVTIVGKRIRGSSDTTNYTITKTGAKQITLSGSTSICDRAAIVNITVGGRDLGIKLVGSYTGSTVPTQLMYAASMDAGMHYTKIDGVYAYNIAYYLTDYGASAAETTTSSTKNFLQYISYYQVYPCNTAHYRIGGFEMENAHFIHNQSYVWGGYVFYTNNGSMNKVTTKGFENSTLFTGNNNTAEDIVVFGGSWSTSGLSYTSLIQGYGWTFDNITMINTVVRFTNGYFTINDYVQRNSDSYGTVFNSSSGVFTNSVLGMTALNNTTADIYVPDDQFPQFKFINCVCARTDATNGILNMPLSVIGSYLRFTNYNGDPTDSRSWYQRGHFLSNSSKLDTYTDVTGYSLTNAYNMSSDTIASLPCRVQVNCKIDNAAYYAGVYTLPKLNVDYDTAPTTATDTADASTDQQVLGVDFTPATSNNPLIVRLTQKTDETTNMKVTWDTLVIRTRLYGKNFTVYTKSIVATTDDIIYSVPTPEDNPVITESNPATVAAYTGIAIDHDAQTMTITESHTLAEIYDYTQYDLTQNMDRAIWFASTDGVNFTSTYDIIVDGCDLTGGSASLIDLGAGTFTRDNDGTYDGITVDSTGRTVHIKIRNVVDGSRILVYDTDGSSTVDNSIVSGTTYNLLYTYTADFNFLIKVKYTDASSAYLLWKTTGIVTNAGVDLTADQIEDTVYATNSVDGSGVTECSVSGATVRIYVDDPDNLTTWQRIYNWYQYILFTEDGIVDQSTDYFYAISAVEYKFDPSMSVINQDLSNPLTITGANVSPTSGTDPIIDSTNGACTVIYSYFPVDASGKLTNLDAPISDLEDEIKKTQGLVIIKR